jgi:DNA-binding transcriptional ArsR family regulator
MERTPADIWSCLAEPRRRRLLELLAEADQGVLELAETLGISPATCSHHLAALRRVGLVGHRREGRYRDYFLQPAALELASQWLSQLRHKRDRPGWNQEAYREHCLASWLGGPRDKLPEHPRRRQVVLEWFHSLLERDRMLSTEDLERAWGPHAKAWEPVLAELERQGRLERRERYILVSD